VNACGTWDFPSWTPTTSPRRHPARQRDTLALVDAFGSAVLDAEAHWIASSSPTCVSRRSALRRLNAITHAPIGVEIARRLDGRRRGSLRGHSPLSPEHRAVFSLDAVWSVQVSPETAVRRLIDDADSVKPTRGPVWPRR